MRYLNKFDRKFMLSALALSVASAWQVPASAQDIDIFLNPKDSKSSAPNVLLMIGNQANWANSYSVPGVKSRKEAVLRALGTVVQDDALLGKVNLGMMVGLQGGNNKGGKVIAAVRDFDKSYRSFFECLIFKYEYFPATTVLDRDDNKVSFPETKGCFPEGTLISRPGKQNKIENISIGGYVLENSSSTSLALGFHEAYLYFSGKEYDSGRDNDLTDNKVVDWVDSPYTIYTNNKVNVSKAPNPELVADPNAFLSGAGAPYSQYRSPAQEFSCADNFIVLINTGSIDSSEDGGALAALRKDSGKEPEMIRLSPSNEQGSWADEYAQFLSSVDTDPDMEGDQSIITYVIDVYDPNDNDTTPVQAQRALLKSIAARGKGRYFAAADADDVAKALTDILNEVQAVNSSFASASMPISMTAENQGTNENQVYIGMFRPDETGRPRWMGNLKRYQYKWDAVLQAPYLAGADGAAAYDPVTGFINGTTTSFWTRSSSYWGGIEGYDQASDAPDGPVVEKGAGAQVLRERLAGGTPRRLLTCDESCSSGNALKTWSPPLDADVLKWLQGYDVANETGRANPQEGRPSIHGDVLHSRPLVINYNLGTAGSEDVVVFYGANDGFFRAVRGEDGRELWAMSFLEHQEQFQQLYDNEPSSEEGKLLHPYFMDGSPTSYVKAVTRTDGSRYIDSAWLYLTMRRGGNFIYALDVSSVSNPKFLWKIQGGTGDFSTLGQTWSSPKPAFVRTYTAGNGTPKPVLFFGAGYDAKAEDYVPGGAGREPREYGQGIYMVDAETGKRLWYYGTGMKFSVAGDLTLVNYSRNPERFADRIYFADTGGNVWRADISDDSYANWKVTKLADLGGDCSHTSDQDCRKFLYSPSVVIEEDGSVSILIGSGDREHPLESTVQNRMYLIRDRGQTTTLSDGDLQKITGSTTQASIDAAKIKNGWYFDLRKGEKVVGNTLTQSGIAYFNTNTPAVQNAKSCVSGLGTAREYTVEYADPLAVADYLHTAAGSVVAGGGFPPPPVPMTLKFGDTIWSGVGGLKPTSPGSEQPGGRRKTFWSRDIDTE